MFLAKDAERDELAILVVEDEVHIREPLGMLLEQKGYQVELAEDGAEGLEKLREKDYFLVISDISMPRMDGLELLARIKEIRPKTDVVMITGNVEEDYAITALKRGAYDYYRKPFDFRDLLHGVDRIVERRRLARDALAYQLLLERTEAEKVFSVESVNGFVQAVEAKDIYTRGHSERVGVVASAFGEYLGLDFEILGKAGRIHDIGKIGIPDSILNKPAQLTPGEYEVIQQHPEIGEKIVTPLSVLRDVAPLIRSHHEWWDGSGYPDGLAGGEIPVEVRVLSIADVADALAHDRAYRPGMPLDEVLRFIAERGGTQFDPELAPEFTRFAEKDPEVFRPDDS